jgi:hypothetical protein
MAFHPRKVLAHLSPIALAPYASGCSADLADLIDWTAPEPEVWNELERVLDTDRTGAAELRSALERIDQLGGEPGDRAMIAACGADLDLCHELEQQPNAHQRALWLLHHQPERFEYAEGIRHTDHFYQGRRWSGYSGPRGLWPELKDSALTFFKMRLTETFRQLNRAGRNVVIETFERGPTNRGRHGEGRVFQIQAYLEGMPATSNEFAETKVVRRNVRPAIEVALVYAPDSGAIDVVADGGGKPREAVAKAFAEELLPVGDRLQPVKLRQLDLSGLAVPQSFPVDPADGIEGVRLTTLRVAPNGPEGHITLVVGAKARQTLHEMAKSWFGASDPLVRRPSILRARLAIKLSPMPGKSRGRTLTVELSVPFGCNLRDQSDLERLIGEKYLRRWGLVREV